MRKTKDRKKKPNLLKIFRTKTEKKTLSRKKHREEKTIKTQKKTIKSNKNTKKTITTQKKTIKTQKKQ